MKNGLYNTCSLKWLFLCAFGIAVTKLYYHAEACLRRGQTKYSKDFDRQNQ